MNYSITQYGKELDESLYTIDEENKVFSSDEDDLVLDFGGENNHTFKTGFNCTFKTGSHCVFDTGFGCTFKTGFSCTFKTGWNCIFKNGTDCILLGYSLDRTYRYFLDESGYVYTKKQLIEIKDKNMAILNMKHENETVRNLCKDILRGKE